MIEVHEFGLKIVCNSHVYLNKSSDVNQIACSCSKAKTTISVISFEPCYNKNYCIKNSDTRYYSRALTGEKPCINKAIHALLMHSYTTLNMLVPGPQNCCCHEMCTARP